MTLWPPPYVECRSTFCEPPMLNCNRMPGVLSVLGRVVWSAMSFVISLVSKVLREWNHVKAGCPARIGDVCALWPQVCVCVCVSIGSSQPLLLRPSCAWSRCCNKVSMVVTRCSECQCDLIPQKITTILNENVHFHKKIFPFPSDRKINTFIKNYLFSYEKMHSKCPGA